MLRALPACREKSTTGIGMKAERSDAPERILRTGRNLGIQRFALYAVIGSIAVISGVTLLSRSETHRGSARPGAEHLRSSPDWGEMNSGSVIRSGPAVDLQSSNTSAHVNQTRQTAFNDQNVIPRGARNVVTFRDTVHPVPEEVSPKPVKLMIVRQSPSMKDRVCWPWKQGSIESRNCRAAVGLRHRD